MGAMTSWQALQKERIVRFRSKLLLELHSHTVEDQLFECCEYRCKEVVLSLVMANWTDIYLLCLRASPLPPTAVEEFVMDAGSLLLVSPARNQEFGCVAWG